jgi:non-heme chloroperoxidase
MSTFAMKDGTQIYYHFGDQMFFLVSRGYHCIAHDRSGHGRSGQP